MDKLRELIEKLEKEIFSIREKNPINLHGKNHYESKCLSLVITNYSDIILILKRIYDIQSQILETDKKIEDLSLPVGDVIDPQVKHIYDTRDELISYLRLDIKIMYIWINHIEKSFEEAFETCKNKMKSMSALENKTFIRHKFISAHIKDTTYFKNIRVPTESTQWRHGNFEGLKVNFHDRFGAPFKGHEGTINECSKYLPDLNLEDDYYAKIQIIYENIEKITDKNLQRSIRKIITSTGISTESPLEIATLLLEALREYRILKQV